MRDFHPRARRYMRQFSMSLDGDMDQPDIPEMSPEQKSDFDSFMRRNWITMGSASKQRARPDQAPSWQPGATTGDSNIDRQADVAAEAFEKEYSADPATQPATIAKYRPWFEQKVGRFGSPGNEDEAMAAVILTMRGEYDPMDASLGHLFTDEQWARLVQMGLAVGPRTR